jgi:hypothetical protein
MENEVNEVAERASHDMYVPKPLLMATLEADEVFMLEVFRAFENADLWRGSALIITGNGCYVAVPQVLVKGEKVLFEVDANFLSAWTGIKQSRWYNLDAADKRSVMIRAVQFAADNL